MAGAEITVDRSELATLGERIRRLAAGQWDGLLDRVGEELVDQTRERLGGTKVAPDGTPWRPWSARYARTRHGGHSLLHSKGRLVDKILHLAHGGSVVEVGSNLIYAATHQFGRAHIPARPYLGLSDENRAAIEDIAERFLAKLVEGTP